jgi:hypothetical protein
MTKYAVVVSCKWDDYIVGLNALMNGFKYYNSTADFHLVYTQSPEMNQFIESVRKNGFYPNFFAVDVMEHAKQIGTDSYHQSDVFYLVTHRYSYAASLKDYDAVLLLDADSVIFSNFDYWFEVAHKTGRIILKQYYLFFDNPDRRITNVPLFFNPSKFAYVFEKIPEQCLQPGVDDLIQVNRNLQEFNLFSDAASILLPCSRWGCEAWYSFSIEKRIFNGRLYVVTGGNEIISLAHGRWWNLGVLRGALVPGEEYKSDHRTKLLWWTYYFFNTQCYHRIEWNEQRWGNVEKVFGSSGSI